MPPDPAAAPGGASPPAAPGAAPTPTWHDGVEADTLGFWQNKGWNTADPKVLATDITKGYREFEKHWGVPPDQIAKLPGPNSKPEDIKAFWGKLGVPSKAEDYDLSAFKIDDKPLTDEFVGLLRNAFTQANVAKDKAGGIVDAFLKWMNDGDLREKTVLENRISKEKGELEKSWGANHQYNLLRADEGARRFGLSNEEVSAIGNAIGVGRAAEMFRRIGEGLKEDGLVSGGGPQASGGVPRTIEGAQARLNQLKADKDWTARMTQGRATPAELDEFYTLSAMAAGEQRIL